MRFEAAGVATDGVATEEVATEEVATAGAGGPRAAGAREGAARPARRRWEVTSFDILSIYFSGLRLRMELVSRAHFIFNKKGEVMHHAGKLSVQGANSSRATSALVSEHRERLVRDLTETLSVIFRWSQDFRDPEGDPSDQGLVPRSVFRAFLGLGLGGVGWLVEREALDEAPRRDIKATSHGFTAVIEAEIWGGDGHQAIQQRLEGSWCPGMSTAVAVMIHAGEPEAFVAGYRTTCLSSPDLAVIEVPATAPLLRRFRVEKTTADGQQVSCDHLLFCLPEG